MTNPSLPAAGNWQTGSEVPEVIDLPVVDVVDHRLVPHPPDALPAVRATTDLNVIQRAVIEAQARRLDRIAPTCSYPPPPPSGSLSGLSVYVTPAGELIAAKPGAERETRVSSAAGDTFYIDLKALQRAVLQQQQNGGRAADEDSVYVDNHGLGAQASPCHTDGKPSTPTYPLDWAEATISDPPPPVSEPSRPPAGLSVYVAPGGELIIAEPRAEHDTPLSSVAGNTCCFVLRGRENRGRLAPKDRVYIDNDGEVMLGRDLDDPSRVSSVVGDTFFIDLNAIQRAVLEQQQNGGLAADKDRVYVDNHGEVMLGSDVGDPSRASSVVGDTFYARDLAVEAYTAQYKMPSAVKVSDGTYEGYAYSIHNDFGDTYELFIYYDQSHRVYRVALVSPRMGGEWDPHGGHLWPDGTLCLTHNAGSGYPSMEQTYAKSVLWTYGASLYRRGYGFQFNEGQDGDSRA